ncbi:NifB/NifX family molybdenum-iron cluster-binding protein [Clostridium saccharoperbutylacetonicum]|uniref:NifB/NifX family molybdenum-iron cluster-binding protein n=1 Tax=Clostridium saccharoperbutylacetonicum TaxID=36745 RepID=UPI000983BF23|nr:NifB/NifX family molybdenum-iron cluster-binding protein [Clostridium saccharoperbutylacetonicum]AQR94089.1 FeMo cofactor biosynthesis protein NifB [Clostridium saccharoperbutylacetonicum]NSB29788.1 putative Fe-Mo cluster-binding NifX family protein [Clostridium saccharoperbutylacetonicum]
MSYKVAFASSDGKVVNQHFGRTKQFLVVEIDKDNKNYNYVETRINEPACQEFQHTEDALKNSIELISDCEAVFVARIGQGALAQVETRGIKGIEAPYFIEDIIDKILNSRVNILNIY